MEATAPGIFSAIWAGLVATSILEWLGVITSVIYVILAARRNILCWVFALLSSACYIYICFASRLYIETMLQVFYFVMGIVGWVLWNKPETGTQEIRTWGIRQNLLNIVLSGALTAILGIIFQKYTDQANPYADAFITCYCLSATYMITKKIHEGWIYLILIDFAAIFLYGARGLFMSSALYIMYTVIAIFAWVAWYKKFRNTAANASADLPDT